VSVDDRTQPAGQFVPAKQRSSGSRVRRALLGFVRFMGMGLALATTVLLAAAVAIVGPNVEEWRGVLPTLDGLGYADSNDIRAADAMGWADKQDVVPGHATKWTGRSGRSYSFLAPATGAALWPGHWCASSTIGFRIDLTGARLAGLNPETERRRWHAALASWQEASKGRYRFEYRGEAKFPLVMNSSVEDMKISDHRLKQGEIAITYATSGSSSHPRWTDYLHPGLGSSLGFGGIGPVNWGAGVSGSGLISSGTIILDAHDVSDLDGRLPTVYVHESGHALGLGHVKNSDQMMYGNAPASAQIGKGDRRGIQKLAAAGCP
jgi:hypothetical protein